MINFGSDMNEIKKKIKEHDEKFALQKNQFDESNKVNYNIFYKFISLFI